MLSKPISTQVFEQPKLGELAYKQAVGMRAKKDAEQKEVATDKQSKGEALAMASAFLPLKHKQVAEAYFGAMESAYVNWKKTGSESDLAVYNSVKMNLMKTIGVGSAKYKNADQIRQSAYGSGFEGIIGGQQTVDGTWDNVINTGYEAVEVDRYGNAFVMLNGEKVPYNERPESDVREIIPGETDFVLQKQTDVPKIATILGAQSIYNTTLDDSKSWDENWRNISRQIGVDMQDKDFPVAAAIYYYRKRKGGTGELTDGEVRKAVSMYVDNQDGAELAQSEWRSDLHDRMKQSFTQEAPDEIDYTKGMSQMEKQALDKPLQMESRVNIARPDGQTVDLDLYSQDVKSLKIPYDAAEGTFIDKIYYNIDGELDHFLVKVPKPKSGDIDFSNFNLESMSIDSYSNPKYTLIRVFDPREFGNTFGERLASMLTDKVREETYNQYQSRGAGATWADEAVSEMQ